MININFNFIKKGIVENNEETLKIFIKNILEYIPRYDENIGHSIKKQIGTLSSSFDEYQLNYLEKSEFKNNMLVNGYSVKNKVEDYDLGEFVEYKFKDNPETWKLRPEINRPWISTG